MRLARPWLCHSVMGARPTSSKINMIGDAMIKKTFLGSFSPIRLLLFFLILFLISYCSDCTPSKQEKAFKNTYLLADKLMGHWISQNGTDHLYFSKQTLSDGHYIINIHIEKWSSINENKKQEYDAGLVINDDR